MSSHHPDRPLWACRECARPWPCPTWQEWALVLYRGDRQAFFWRLGGVVGQMIDDDVAPRPDIFIRVFGWVPGGGDHAPPDSR